MLDLSNTSIDYNIAIHKVGNSTHDEPLALSHHLVALDDDMSQILQTYFLNAFKTEEYYRFTHLSNLAFNTVYNYVSSIFADKSTLQAQSVLLAQYLYEKSTHPKVKGGEFYVAYFQDCLVNGEQVDAIGLFKSENKDYFLQVRQHLDYFEVNCENGIHINKLDKGCLIYNIQKENGYLLSIVDNLNKGIEAQYWKDDFLGVLVENNDYHKTKEVMNVAKLYVAKQLEEEFEVTKTDQIDYLNKSIHYFKEKDAFTMEDFAEDVFTHSEVVDSFVKFSDQYCQEHNLRLDDEFTISAQAVKKQMRGFKNVLKLDKNFHIYIHGNRDLIEQGIDEEGRKFYKIYYEQES